MKLSDKRILVTGGSSGIGAEVARQLGRRGNPVAIVAHEAERLARVEASLRAEGVRVEAHVCDLGSRDDVARLASKVLANGPIDVVVNNAGYGVYRLFERETVEELDRLLDVNLAGHMRLTKLLLPAMIERRSGAVHFVASIAGKLPITPNAVYCAAKHGMFGLAEALRYELRRFGIEVTVACPGRVDTPFFEHPTFRERRLGPENRSALPAEAAAAATIRGIESARPLTYVPSYLGFAAWLYEAASPLTRPVYSYLMKNRIERLYADIDR